MTLWDRSWSAASWEGEVEGGGVGGAGGEGGSGYGGGDYIDDDRGRNQRRHQFSRASSSAVCDDHDDAASAAVQSSSSLSYVPGVNGLRSFQEPQLESFQEPHFESFQETQHESIGEAQLESFREPHFESFQETQHESIGEAQLESFREPHFESFQETQHESIGEAQLESFQETQQTASSMTANPTTAAPKTATLMTAGNDLIERPTATTIDNGSGDAGGEEVPTTMATMMIPASFDDAVGITFKLNGKEESVCLPCLGSYVKFNTHTEHRGYKTGTVRTWLTAQLFAAPTKDSKRPKQASFQEGFIAGPESITLLATISDAIKTNWETVYMNKKYNPPTKFQGKKLTQ